LEVQHQLFAFCGWFGVACVNWTESSTCYWSICSCVWPIRNENKHWKGRRL